MKRQALITIRSAIQSLQYLEENFQHQEFDKVIEIIEQRSSKLDGCVVFFAIGKSGHISNKLKATFSSTGTRARFIHAAEANHGDLAEFNPARDVAVFVSNSGESSEMLPSVKAIKRQGAPIITVCNKPDSTLCKYTDVNLKLFTKGEQGCPLGVAPMDTTTVTLVLGDAIAAELMARKGFTKEDFGSTHLGGLLGRTLVSTVSDFMATSEDFPVVSYQNSLDEFLKIVDDAGLGCAVVVDDNDHVIGFISDGDIRRALLAADSKDDITVEDMNKTPNPITVHKNELGLAALHTANSARDGKGIGALVVVDDDNKPVGLVSTKVLIRELT